ncbi:MAG: hypothetical protein A3C50_02225 [Candidatus Staskawiczbacteria bacterium RIFCSPHIGHO2_02_FULL_43_16]|uniref:Type II secretion system protein GspF domain-containing protein n=1 Tax=Candidatus Staskawiczbacteria bacterium RIFCSPHIGHO2_01_FULL_41_41 TaxID=1802203 RepID=A0A1G2HWT8_9BACT|nr:MAG: hypothetical protein A2822_00595 [Candidatus Staskawiczbacteria bacterium RIFCSPHIGHO2_01_FULL_41_41]OGZ68494.1 MAG: hypothetical protein A3C50_02225 [Candidatus Staskawiczbacteria bacterium RIFCSPHIGHO2_02_FULL_43_16]OGZ74298.1 MAG: hypothetical protein A3A12_02660 [Candidatus Staskawiczbacteria bacterium RIFCSPLOWO2_01_FULL_43_17b]
MPNFSYKAKSFEGADSSGKMQAVDERELALALKAQGLILIDAAKEGKKRGLNMEINVPFLGVSSTEKIMMTRNLGVMFSTGLSMVKIFDILSIQSKSRQLKDALANIKDSVSKGENLSDALARYPKIFNELFVNMIKVGEESGTLDEIFQILALQLGKEHELKSKIKNAMTYPAIIVLVMLCVGVVIITIVLPSLDTFFTSLNVPIPFYTRAVLWGGRFLSKNWWLLFAGPAALVGAVMLIIRTPKGKWALDTLLLRLPVVSQIVKKGNSAFLIRSLSSLIASGVPLIRALEISSKTVGNQYFSKALVEAAVKIKKGEKLSGALREHANLFSFGVIEMMEVGEETGKTAVILKKLAEFYEQEAGAAVEKMAILIEPMLIIFLGVSVGFFAFSIIQPMYSSLKFIGS